MRGVRGTAALAVAFAAVAAVEILWLHLLQPLGNRLTDSLQRVQAARVAPDPQIVILDIDEASLGRMQEEAGRWPWPRAVYAELLPAVLAQQPKAVVFDILFTEKDSLRPDSDEAFAEVLRTSEIVYLPMVRLDPKDDPSGVPLREVADALGLKKTAAADPTAHASLLPPLALPPETWRTGTINYLEDADGVGRRYYVHHDLYGWQLFSLPARLAHDFGWGVPAQDSIRLSFRSGSGGFRHVSFADVFDDLKAQPRRRPVNEFRDAIVVIGTAASGLRDQRVTPLSSLYPGVEILATAIDNLKNARSMYETSTAWPAVLALLLIAATAAAFAAGAGPFLVGGALLAGCLLLLGASWFALQQLVVLSVFEPIVFAAAFYGLTALLSWRRERAARLHAVAMFGRFLNPEVVRRLVDRGETVESLSGRSCEVSVLFSDIRGFTSLSETRPPQEIVDLLNRYFSRQVAVVFRHGGTLDKFIGDCIMAFWGAPLNEPRHARRAVECALDMERELLAFRRELGEAGRDFDVGIGIHSGTAVVGFIGAEQKLDYTAIGDTVNLASRIEGLTKGVARVLVSADTAQACADADLHFISRGAFPVKGRARAVELFEPSVPR
ncbi:adenylate cyclase [Panacagrimonas perspica]|uniref:Adenylate cyclase n=2 Tax=Panacagrimonas perspica TaxID=381431 RepID=A0A4S3K4B8_9GAMM|nr:adenylate/guanylate cyclase domain-containing protein [Panacagrimonas perspica]TDU25740.1 adenylate cyclase [Panacagrimonas perspica]THD02876.1 adenylate/guanylate cyclase domain-containing protein [Panacagrimonas perspica]